MPHIIEWLKLPAGYVWHIRHSDYGQTRTLCGRKLPESKKIYWWLGGDNPPGQHCKVCVVIRSADEQVRAKSAREKKQS